MFTYQQELILLVDSFLSAVKLLLLRKRPEEDLPKDPVMVFFDILTIFQSPLVSHQVVNMRVHSKFRVVGL